MDKRRFLIQALLLTAVSLLLRTVGVSAQVYISARIGAEAVGVSSLIGGVGSFAVTLALSGIHLGCTRLVSEGLGKSDTAFIHRALRAALGHALFFGLAAALLLFFGAPIIASHWVRDMRTISSLRLMALSLPAIALSSCLSGYFVAVRRVWKSACMQVAEEALRIALTLLFLSRMVSGGLESALLALALANAIADIAASVALLALFLHDRAKHLPGAKPSSQSPSMSAVVHRLIAVTLPVAGAAYARSGLITLEHMLIPIGLRRYGQSHAAALASYGTLHSMALPVVLFPCALLSSFASLLVPELTEAHVRSEHDRIRAIMQLVFRLTLLFSIGAAGILLFFSQQLGRLLYHSEEAALYIRALAPLIPVMYMDSATDAMLKGLGQQVYSMKVNIVDSSISVLLVWLLLPTFGIRGYIATIYFTELLNASLSITRLLQISGLHAHIGHWVVKPLLAIVGATAPMSMLLHLIAASTCVLSPLSLSLHILVTSCIYGGFLILLGAWRTCDFRWMKGFFLPCRSP